MSNKINMDELLKQELGNMTQEPPVGAWEAISSQVQATQVASQTVNAVASVAKTSSIITTKLIIIASAVVVTSLVSLISYIVLSPSTENTVNKVFVNNQSDAPQEQPEKPLELNDAIKKEEDSKTILLQESKPAKKKRSIRQNTVTEKSISIDDKEHEGVTQTNHTNTQQNNLPQSAQLNKTERPSYDKEYANTLEDNSMGKDSLLSEENHGFPEPFIPDVFTPNNDGVNDEFIISIENEILYDLKITDIRGNIVFESRDKNKNWNGINISSGKVYEESTYIVAFSYQIKGMKTSAYKTKTLRLITQRQ